MVSIPSHFLFSLTIVDDYDLVGDVEDNMEDSVYQCNSKPGLYEDTTRYQTRREEQPGSDQFEPTSDVQREESNTEQESRGRSVQLFAPCLSFPLKFIVDLSSIGMLDWIRETQIIVSSLMKFPELARPSHVLLNVSSRCPS
jgi:hypothetical protein